MKWWEHLKAKWRLRQWRKTDTDPEHQRFHEYYAVPCRDDCTYIPRPLRIPHED